MKLFIIGHQGGTHIGGSFERGAVEEGIDVRFIDASLSESASFFYRKIWRRLSGNHPAKLAEFGDEVVKQCGQYRPAAVLTTGMAPMSGQALLQLKRMKIRTINYSTDDPWNPAFKAGWFISALRHYESVYTCRRSNQEAFVRAGCAKVFYMPFAYDPQLCPPAARQDAAELEKFKCDLVFVGSGDSDRLGYVKALKASGIDFRLYGPFWDRFPEARRLSLGPLDPPSMLKALAAAKISLCLVRRSNRDGNSMRTFEIPAIGTCMLTEFTEEHHEIFGKEGSAVLYFKTPGEMIEKARFLLQNEEERKRLAASAHRLIVEGGHTYRDRLRTMLNA